MNKKLLYIVLSLGFLASSCSKDFLEQKAPDKVTVGQYWKDENAADQYLVSTYAALSQTSWRWGEYYFTPLNYKGDDIVLLPGSSDWAYLANMGQFSYDSGNSTISTYWKKNYQSLRYANDVILNIPKIPEGEVSDESRNYLMGEGYFLRALSHFYLNVNFTTVVLIDEAISGENVFKKDATKEEAWALIVSDLKMAASLLPAERPSSESGRATTGAALGFLGKALLYQGKHSEAAVELQKVIALGLYGLTDDFEGMFNGTNKNSKEGIFEIQHTIEESGGMWYSASQASYVGTAPIDGWHMFAPSNFLISEFEKERTVANGPDKRLTATICYDDADGMSNIFGSPWSLYFDAGAEITSQFKKYVDGQNQTWNGVSGCNVPLLRYADILLMYAESLNESGGDATMASNALNEVRSRAGLSDFAGSGVDALREEIRHQRILEFSCEGQRFQDMVRYGNVEQTLRDNGHGFVDNYSEKCNYYPIPAIEVSQNNMVSPTPGY